MAALGALAALVGSAAWVGWAPARGATAAGPGVSGESTTSGAPQRGQAGPSTEPSQSEPAPQEPTGDEPTPTPAPATPPQNAGVVASFGEGVLDVELSAGGHVTGKVITGGTQFSCRSASTNETVTDGCNASLLQAGAGVHEFSVNYGPNGAWFQRIIIVLA